MCSTSLLKMKRPDFQFDIAKCFRKLLSVESYAYRQCSWSWSGTRVSIIDGHPESSYVRNIWILTVLSKIQKNKKKSSVLYKSYGFTTVPVPTPLITSCFNSHNNAQVGSGSGINGPPGSGLVSHYETGDRIRKKYLRIRNTAYRYSPGKNFRP